jgi:hypothetical protein
MPKKPPKKISERMSSAIAGSLAATSAVEAPMEIPRSEIRSRDGGDERARFFGHRFTLVEHFEAREHDHETEPRNRLGKSQQRSAILLGELDAHGQDDRRMRPRCARYEQVGDDVAAWRGPRELLVDRRWSEHVQRPHRTQRQFLRQKQQRLHVWRELRPKRGEERDDQDGGSDEEEDGRVSS